MTAAAEPTDDDPFGTAALRAGVLAAWGDSPTRFREDANAEEDLRLGGYADTWCVELAQNAADAARAAGVPGRVRIVVDDGELRVANTGAPLDAAGVAALAALRASAKRDDPGSVGRFGVGFAAVLALSDAPRVVTAQAGVAFSASATAQAVRELPGPAAELARRDGQLPVLRLVWPTGPDEPPVPEPYATEVRLPLRPGLDPAVLLGAAAAAAPDLLLALPDLVEIMVDGVPVRRAAVSGTGRPSGVDEVVVGEQRWLLVRGHLAGAADPAVEQRRRHIRSYCWALPLDPDGGPAPLDDDVLHAPTATAERLGLPARLIADVPLEPDRRHARSGAGTDAVLRAAADAYLDLVAALAPADRVALVPVAGFPRSELDARLRALLLDVLRAAAWLPAAGGGEVAPRAATLLDVPGADDLPALLAEVVPGLLAQLPAPRRDTRGGPAALPTELGVHRMGGAELADRLLGVHRPASWWHAVYAALEPAVDTVPGLRDELRGLPVPLADGRTVAGPAGVLLPHGADAGGLGELGLPGLHVADPAAVHPLLARLGAAPAEPAGLLDHPAVRDAVDRSVDDADAGLDPVPLAEAVLALVDELGPAAAVGRGWLSALALTDVDGVAARADELMLPDAALRPLLAADAPLAVLGPEWERRAPREVLVAVGVVDGFVVLHDDVTAPEHDLDDLDRWLHEPAEPPAELVAVRDLDLVRDDAWPAALALLAARPDTRAAVVAPHSYTAWWLARHALLHGHRPGHWRLPSAEGLAALYDPVPGARGLQPGGLQPGGLQPGGLQPGGLQPGRLQPGALQPGGLQQGVLTAIELVQGHLAATPTGPVATPAGPVATPTVPAATPTGPAATPTGPAATPTGPAATPTGPAATPTGPAATPTGPVATPTDPAATPTGPAATPTGPAATPTVPDGAGPPPVDEAVLAAAGVRADLTVADARDAADLLARLAEPRRHPDAALTAAAHAALADAVADGRVDPADLDPPDRVRALDGTVADAGDAVVLDAPWLAAVLPPGELVAGGDPRALADLLDLPTASEVVDAEVVGAGRPVAWGGLPEVVVTCHALGVAVPRGQVRLHDRLEVVLHRPTTGRRRVPAWRDGDGGWHAEDPVRALLGVLAAPSGGGNARPADRRADPPHVPPSRPSGLPPAWYQES